MPVAFLVGCYNIGRLVGAACTKHAALFEVIHNKAV